MDGINTKLIEIPALLTSGWQTMLDLVSEDEQIPASLIMRLSENTIDVFVSSNSLYNPYFIGDKEALGKGLYCETVISTQSNLLVENALNDKQWHNNPDTNYGMISYFGCPICWPNGEPFGTICVLDSKENKYSEKLYQNLNLLRLAIEANLKSLYQLKVIEAKDKRLSSDPSIM